MKLIYEGPNEAVIVAGVGRVPMGSEFLVDEARGKELLAKTRQSFKPVETDPADMTVAGLKAELEARGIAFDASSRKADLAALLAGLRKEE